ncbi:Septum site-determining protein MinC [Buchnera aphidicola (Phyllaphis fagi)]
MLQADPIEFKGGIFTIPVLYLKSYQLNIVKISILKKIKEYPKFFKNSSIILNLSYLSCLINWKDMKQMIISTGLDIIAITGYINQILKQEIVKSGLPIISENNKFYKNIEVKKHDHFLNNKIFKTKIINTPIRSGQKIYAHQSDLIINNHVNRGAELIADGNIHIYGIMKGRVLAGVNGDITRQIFCTKFFAELVSISGEYLLMDQISSELLGQGVYIFLKNNILSIYPLK